MTSIPQTQHWLYDAIVELAPKHSLVRDLADAVQALPGIEAWQSDAGLENRWYQILSLGFDLWLAKDLPGSAPILRAIGESLVARNEPDVDAVFELVAAGLCRAAFGPKNVQRLQRTSARTADWRVTLDDGVEVDVEATRSRKKDGHLALEAAAHVLAQAVHEIGRPFDVFAHMVDPVSRKDCDEVLSAIAKLDHADELVEIAGRWQVRATRIDRDPYEILSGRPTTAPTWWPQRSVRSFILYGFVAGPQAVSAPPQIRIAFPVPFDAYVNSAMGKANRPQGDPNRPFLIAIDVSALTDGLREMPRAIADFLAQWPHVSGFLFCTGFSTVDTWGWKWRIVENPHATHPLPAALKKYGETHQIMETAIKFR